MRRPVKPSVARLSHVADWGRGASWDGNPERLPPGGLPCRERSS